MAHFVVGRPVLSLFECRHQETREYGAIHAKIPPELRAQMTFVGPTNTLYLRLVFESDNPAKGPLTPREFSAIGVIRHCYLSCASE